MAFIAIGIGRRHSPILNGKGATDFWRSPFLKSPSVRRDTPPCSQTERGLGGLVGVKKEQMLATESDSSRGEGGGPGGFPPGKKDRRRW